LNPEQKLRDEERQQQLEQMGLNFLRFSEQQVLKDMDWVINAIKNYVVAFEDKHHILAH
jgi:very-short-patch-repair endonuclease